MDKLKMKDVVFDSNIHKWKEDESEFDQLILNKQNLIFLIESHNDIKFGVFISSKINKDISDENAFIFTFKDNKPMKFDIKKNKKDFAFLLKDKSDDSLFDIGNYDIYINKQNIKSSIRQEDRSSFDYKGIENALIGREGFWCFTAKRVMVIQMKEKLKKKN